MCKDVIFFFDEIRIPKKGNDIDQTSIKAKPNH